MRAFLFQLVGNIIGLILNPVEIIIAVRRQIFITDFFPIDPGFIKTQACDIESGGNKATFVLYSLMKDGMAFDLIITADPFGYPWLIHLGSFKEMLFTDSFLSGFIRCNTNCPGIAGARFQFYPNRFT